MSINRMGSGLALIMAGAFFAPPALSHVSVAPKEAHVGAAYRAVLRVPHGCKGSPTTGIRVRIPEGVVGVKPQPKPGWTLETVKGDYARSYTRHGAEVTSGVKEIAWKGGPLPDEHYDEFVFVTYLTDSLTAGRSLYFPVVQECEGGVERWIDVPDEKAGHGHGHGHDHGHDHGHGEGGANSHDHSDSPAPAVKLLPAQ